MVTFYKNYKDYSIKEGVHRHTAKTRIEEGIIDGNIIEIPKGTKYITVK